jgi:hypothetical protein
MTRAQPSRPHDRPERIGARFKSTPASSKSGRPAGGRLFRCTGSTGFYGRTGPGWEGECWANATLVRNLTEKMSARREGLASFFRAFQGSWRCGCGDQSYTAQDCTAWMR